MFLNKAVTGKNKQVRYRENKKLKNYSPGLFLYMWNNKNNYEKILSNI